MDVITNKPWTLFVLAVLGVLLLQSPLIFNPGYLSHDELQWAYYATHSPGGFFGNGLWGDIHAFQYRPLTFSLWMVLSRHLFEHPYAFHAVLVMWGAINTGLLAQLLRRAGAEFHIALLGALVFALGPYASYIHGWVGTIADLIWLSCALSIGLVAMHARRAWVIVAIVSALTTVALLSKEAAIVIPVLVLLAWWFSGRQRAWGIAMFAAGAPVAIYLALRLGSILFSKATTGSIYQWSFASIPVRWLEYQLFPVLTSRLGAGDFLQKGFGSQQIQMACVGWLLLVAALWRVGWRWVAAFVLGGAAALGPVLLLGGAANQYGYGFAAVTAGVVALAWREMPRVSRVIVAIYALFCVWHGVNIVRSTHDIGVKQSHFSPALAQAVKASTSIVRLRPEVEKDRWIYERLTFDIPGYQGVAIGGRVQLVSGDEASDYLITSQGDLKIVRTR
ncbi:MAG TPA: hypothetical protein VFG49_01375 [Dyella sp.]|uniref:hypothetical protein n=1 Tax=Dyella sp. TaxID=1869338 RepID=UPI002D7955D8|nr:hypothetical protein [Dyella sp.]HET6552162.1 hypothetical protein [Dyella sp.]